MTKADIVDVIARGTGLTKVETAAVIDGFLATVTYALQNGDRVELRGFGTFCLRERQEKHVANPRTGEMMHIPHRIVPDFKPSPQFKHLVEAQLKEAGKFVSKTETDVEEPPVKQERTMEQINIFGDLDRFFIDEE